ncbi:MAG TPA: hypothetical protein VMS43_05555 [Allosphingosinicella sp.]|nr:hypothetical protein [Allosphingosinicella sp.]
MASAAHQGWPRAARQSGRLVIFVLAASAAGFAAGTTIGFNCPIIGEALAAVPGLALLPEKFGRKMAV